MVVEVGMSQLCFHFAGLLVDVYLSVLLLQCCPSTTSAGASCHLAALRYKGDGISTITVKAAALFVSPAQTQQHHNQQQQAQQEEEEEEQQKQHQPRAGGGAATEKAHRRSASLVSVKKVWEVVVSPALGRKNPFLAAFHTLDITMKKGHSKKAYISGRTHLVLE
jgi:predicted metalloprotease